MNTSFARLLLLLSGVYLLSFALTRGFLTESSGRLMQAERLASPREFSDVAQIPGLPAVLIVEDETKDSLLLMRVSPPGRADSPVVDIPLPAGFALKDMEGIAIDPRGFVYVVSSHSLNSEGNPRRGSALARMTWREPGRLAAAETIADLRPWLDSEFPELSAVKNLSADSGGLNIEGLAFDPDRDRLLLGLRGPLFDQHPALIPIRLKAPAGPFNRQTLELQPPVILHDITGFGIRSISFDHVRRGFWLITGGSGKKGKNRFHLGFWEFSKDGDQGEWRPSPVKFDKTISDSGENYKLHPEGISAVRLPTGEDFLMIVTDGSPFYFKLVE